MIKTENKRRKVNYSCYSLKQSRSSISVVAKVNLAKRTFSTVIVVCQDENVNKRSSLPIVPTHVVNTQCPSPFFASTSSHRSFTKLSGKPLSSSSLDPLQSCSSWYLETQSSFLHLFGHARQHRTVKGTNVIRNTYSAWSTTGGAIASCSVYLHISWLDCADLLFGLGEIVELK